MAGSVARSRAHPLRPGVTGLAVVASAIVASILPAFLLGALSVEIRAEVGYGEATAGLIFSSFFIASAVVSSWIGRAIDRVGSRRGFLLALAAVAVVQLLIAAIADSAWLLALLASLAGVANSTAQLSANVYIATQMRYERQGIGFAVKQSAMPGASLVAGVALPTVALTLGWRWVFVLAGLLSAAMVAAVIRWLPDPPVAQQESAVGDPGDAETPDRLAAAGCRSDGELGDTRAHDGDDTLDRGGDPLRAALLTLAAAAALSTAAAITLGSFFVESGIDAGLAASTAGVAFAVGSLISIAVRLMVGAIADRRPGNMLGVVAAMLALGAASSVIFTIRVPWVQLLGVPIAFGLGWAWPGLFNLSVVRAAPSAPGRATGITQTGTYVGGAIGPVLFGAIAQGGSYAAAWWTATALGLAAAVAVLAGRWMLSADRADSIESAGLSPPSRRTRP